MDLFERIGTLWKFWIWGENFGKFCFFENWKILKIWDFCGKFWKKLDFFEKMEKMDLFLKNFEKIEILFFGNFGFFEHFQKNGMFWKVWKMLGLAWLRGPSGSLARSIYVAWFLKFWRFEFSKIFKHFQHFPTFSNKNQNFPKSSNKIQNFQKNNQHFSNIPKISKLFKKS